MNTGVSKNTNARPELIDWCIDNFNIFLKKINAFSFKCIVVISSLALPVVSIWYSGWYPDAQQNIVAEQKKINLENGVSDEVAKPSFVRV